MQNGLLPINKNREQDPKRLWKKLPLAVEAILNPVVSNILQYTRSIKFPEWSRFGAASTGQLVQIDKKICISKLFRTAELRCQCSWALPRLYIQKIAGCFCVRYIQSTVIISEQMRNHGSSIFSKHPFSLNVKHLILKPSVFEIMTSVLRGCYSHDTITMRA